jgi:hypothetical protein
MNRFARILPALLIAASGAASAQTMVCTKMYFRPGVANGNVCVPDTEFEDRVEAARKPGHAYTARDMRPPVVARTAPRARKGH